MASWITSGCLILLLVLLVSPLLIHGEVRYVDDWMEACKDAVEQAKITDGFVNQDGEPTVPNENMSWGINRTTCYEHCGRDKFHPKFDTARFASSVTNWLLPWLALTSQLPFETATYSLDALSLLLAVGSPALVTYSLTITILNRSWIRSRFDELLKRAARLDPDGRQQLCKRLKDARTVLEDSQQAPLRLSQVDGWLSSLIVLDRNAKWWENVRRTLDLSRREWQYSLLAQFAAAGISFGLTVISIFNAEMGNPKVALQLSSGCLWLWLLPVIMGWLSVGTQSKDGTISSALTDAQPRPHRAPREADVDASGSVASTTRPPSVRSQDTVIGGDDVAGEGDRLMPQGSEAQQGQARQGDVQAQTLRASHERRGPSGQGTEDERIRRRGHRLSPPDAAHQRGRSTSRESRARPRHTAQQGIRVVSGLMPRPHRSPAPAGHSSLASGSSRRRLLGPRADEDDTDPSRLEKVKPARWSRIEYNIGDERREGPTFNFWRVFTWWQAARTIADAFEHYLDQLQKGEEPDENSAEKVAEICRLPDPDSNPMEAYPSWEEVPRSLWKRLGVAVLAAIWVQWGTTGAAFLIAYETPTKGLGCRSGSYLIYGVAGTVSWALLALSSILSHGVMLRCQAIHDADPAAVLTALNRKRRRLGRSTLVLLAHLTNRFGKILVASNAAWLITSSLFEYTEFYASCWCASNSVSLGARGWASIYNDAGTLKAAAFPSWVGGIFLSAIVCVAALAFFWMGSHRKGDGVP